MPILSNKIRTRTLNVTFIYEICESESILQLYEFLGVFELHFHKHDVNLKGKKGLKTSVQSHFNVYNNLVQGFSKWGL